MKWINRLLITCIIILTTILCIGLPFLRKKPMPTYLYSSKDFYTAYHKLMDDYKPPLTHRSEKEYREKISNDLNLHLYIYMEFHLNHPYVGMAMPLIRTITVDPNVCDEEYIFTFAHEVIHLKHHIKQENYVNYQTFKYLYESSDSHLHSAAQWFALGQIMGHYPPEYDCHSQIIKYLLEN